MTGSTLHSLARFLPGALVEWAATASPDSLPPPREEYICALLNVDISGFTRLTSRLSRNSGQTGAERIGVILNGYLSNLIEAIETHGGTILVFEGDSLLAGWRSGPKLETLSSAVARSCSCALSLQRQFGKTAIECEELTLRSAISAGKIKSAHLLVGTDNPRVLLAGQAIEDVCHCIALADGGETLLSADAWAHVAGRAEGERTDNSTIRLLGIADPPAAVGSAAANAPNLSDMTNYLPAVVRAQFSAPLWDWAAELRTVTSSFIRVTAAGLLDDFSDLEYVLDILQKRLARVGGDLLRVSPIEGGIQALAVCGLPGHAHQDNPRRALVAALEIQSELSGPNRHVSIGIASGDVFCGAVGTEKRAEYTVLGESVNRAARLASLAAGRILTDDITAQQTAVSIEVQGPWPMAVPGLRTAILAYVAVGQRVQRPPAPRSTMIGRTDELSRLVALLGRGLSRASAVVIVGEAGVGKSTLASAFMDYCRKQSMAVLDAFADEIEKNTPYYTLRQPLKRLFGLGQLAEDVVYGRIEERLARHPESIQFIPLLSDVVGIDLPQSASLREMPSSVRFDNLRLLLKHLFLDIMYERPSVLLIEDYQWIDLASANLLVDLASSGESINIVLTSRSELAGDDALRQAAELVQLKLESLDQAYTAELIKSSLQGIHVSAALKGAIWQRTGGNPFFVGELCRVIQHRQNLPPELSGDNDAELAELPQSARAAVLNRTDNLSVDDQFVLKIASVMGSAFCPDDFEGNELIQKAALDPRTCISRLESVHLLKPVDAVRFAFSHRIIRDVVYASMLSDQKKTAHAAVAEALEKQSHVSAVEKLPLLLHHWKRAGDRKKIIEYLDRVAELRLRQFENDSAIAHCVEFLSIAEEEMCLSDPARLASAYFVMGKAQINLGRFETARTNLEQGLRTLKLPMPRTALGLTAGILAQASKQAMNSSGIHKRFASPASGVVGSEEIDNITLKTARAYEDLTNIFYFQGNKPRLVYSILRGTNLAEAVGMLSPVLAVNYACIGAICGVIPLRNYANHYLNLGESISARLQIPSVTLRVSLLNGLYKTSIGEWAAAKKLFEPALGDALRIGDVRKWGEHAVCLETITSPWLLNPGYAGERVWAALVEEIIQKARRNGDVHILGSGLAGAIRGNRALHAPERNAPYLHEFADLLRDRAAVLEPIHRLEAAAHLADAALDRGDIEGWQHWLERAAGWIRAVNPSMKTRTLPALCAAFQAGVRQPSQPVAGHARKLGEELAVRSLGGLRRFARIYPIGRPRAMLFRGDMEARNGRRKQAAKFWLQAIAYARRFEMPADMLAAAGRLKTCEIVLAAGEQGFEVSTITGLDHFPEYRKATELAAIALNVGGGNAIPSAEAARAAGPGAF